MPRRDRYDQSIWWREVGSGEISINSNWAPVQRYYLELFHGTMRMFEGGLGGTLVAKSVRVENGSSFMVE